MTRAQSASSAWWAGPEELVLTLRALPWRRARAELSRGEACDALPLARPEGPLVRRSAGAERPGCWRLRPDRGEHRVSPPDALGMVAWLSLSWGGTLTNSLPVSRQCPHRSPLGWNPTPSQDAVA